MKALAWPLACYLAMTVVVPIADGAPIDREHVVTVTAAAVLLLGLAYAADRWRTRAEPKGKTGAAS